jgi:hypothetical protein
MRSCFKCQDGDSCPTYTHAVGSTTPLCGSSGLKLKESDVILAERLKCSESTAMACDRYIKRGKKDDN